MIQTIILLLFIITLCTLILISPTLTKLRRDRLASKPFSLLWASVIEQNISIYKRLPHLLRKQLHTHIKIFLAEKQFIGCGGLQVTDEIKLTIAAQACLLLLNERGKYFPKLSSILVYPGAYTVKQLRSTGNYVVEERREVRIGESWARDQVVLSWEHIKYDIRNWDDGHNVVLHEFAHQLDQEDGIADGVPILERKSDYFTWGQVLRQDYQKLRTEVEQGLKTVMDKYGATEPAEFFAVATETFFEKPQQMAINHPELYHQLRRYYKLDPIEWV